MDKSERVGTQRVGQLLFVVAQAAQTLAIERFSACCSDQGGRPDPETVGLLLAQIDMEILAPAAPAAS